MKTKLVVGFFILLLAVLAPSAYALEDSTASPTAKPTIKRLQNAGEKRMETRENAKNRASAAAEKRKEKLSEARLRVCKGRAKAIGNRVERILKRGEKMHGRSEKITEAVGAFYQNRLVPQGLTLSNHDELLADIEAKKASVLSLLETAKASGGVFDCESDDPQGQKETFRSDIKAVIDAFKAYRQSVRTFAKAVKDLAAQNKDSIEEEVVE